MSIDNHLQDVSLHCPGANRYDRDAGTATLNETRALVSRDPADAASSIREILEPYDLPSYLTEDLTTHLTKSPNLVQFLMHFQHNTPEQEASRALTCALTIACGYFLGEFDFSSSGKVRKAETDIS